MTDKEWGKRLRWSWTQWERTMASHTEIFDLVECERARNHHFKMIDLHIVHIKHDNLNVSTYY